MRFANLSIFLFILTSIAGTALAESQEQDWVSRNDIIYQSPPREGWKGLLLGNGTLGAQAWMPEGMMFQLNTPWSGAMGGAIARLNLQTSPGLLVGRKSFTQRLELSSASLVTHIVTEKGVFDSRSFIPAQSDALIIEVNDAREGISDRIAELEVWRNNVKCSTVSDVIVISDQIAPDYRFAMAVGVAGAPATAESADKVSPRLRIQGGKFTVIAAFAGTRDAKADVVAEALARLENLRKQDPGAVRRIHDEWWSKFWSRSYVYLSSDDGTADYLANLWYIHIYAMAAGSRGELPPKFNGGLWTDNRDEREWGSGYWHWNTQETYWPLYSANHLDLLSPYYKMYFEMLPKVEQQTRAFFGIEGANFPETCGWDGLDQTGKGEKKMGVHPRLPVPKQGAATNLILSSSAEIAMQFWWYYLYTGDKDFLRGKAYPLMRSAAEFYLGYLEKDASGRYVMFPSNAHETFWQVKNPTTDLSAIRYLFPTLIAASKILGVDESKRPIWEEHLKNLAPYGIDKKTNSITPYELAPEEKLVYSNAENPDLSPIGVFPLITLGSPDYDLGVRTFRARHHVNTYGWTTDSICAARLGLSEDVRELLVKHVELYQDHPSGLMDYYPRKPAIHPYLEGSGTFSTGLGEMLLQSWGKTVDGPLLIRICPALPKEWNAQFKLLAVGGFEVSAVAEKGKVVTATIVSQLGGEAQIINPFGKGATVADEGRAVLKSDAEILVFPTQAGHSYVLSPSSAPVPKIEVPNLKANNAPKRLTPVSLRWIGIPDIEATAWKPEPEPDAPKPPAPISSIERPANPELKPVIFTTPPKIDGDLSDECWRSCPTLGPLFLLGKKIPAREQTDVRVGCDAKHLYIGMVCWESQMSQLVTDYENGAPNRDMSVFQDDSVEVFLGTVPATYWHLAANALGTQYDALCTVGGQPQSNLNPEWQVVASRKSNRWIVEMAIPYASMAPWAPASGESWLLNVCRNQKPLGELSSWAPLSKVSYHLPDEFGRLIFTNGEKSRSENAMEPDLIGAWSGEGLNGAWVRDQSGHGHHAMLTEAVKLADGRTGPALDLCGGFLQVFDAPELNFSDAMTIMAWINPRTEGSMRIIDKGPAGGSDAYLLDTHPSNNLRVITNFCHIQIEKKLPVNTWSHVALTFGDGSLRVYLDGELVSERTNLNGKLTGTKLPLRIGADSGGGSRFNGLMEDVMIWHRALKPEEIKKLMKSPPWRKTKE